MAAQSWKIKRIMSEKLEYLLRQFAGIKEEQLGEILACFNPKIVKKNTVLLSEGNVCKEFYYVEAGCIRTYFITRQGHEKTRLVIPDCSIGTALTSFISQKPSFEVVDALEDTTLWSISHANFYKLNDEFTEWKNFYTKILEMAYSFQNSRLENLVTLSAKQRYDELLHNNPALIQRLSNKVLASYLDMTQETLSRLKSK